MSTLRLACLLLIPFVLTRCAVDLSQKEKPETSDWPVVEGVERSESLRKAVSTSNQASAFESTVKRVWSHSWLELGEDEVPGI